MIIIITRHQWKSLLFVEEKNYINSLADRTSVETFKRTSKAIL